MTKQTYDQPAALPDGSSRQPRAGRKASRSSALARCGASSTLRMVTTDVAARIVYEIDGKTYVGVREASSAMRLFEVRNGDELNEVDGKLLDEQTLDRLVATKRVRRRLDIARGTIDHAIVDYFTFGGVMGEFQLVKTPLIYSARHVSSVRANAGKRFKPVSFRGQSRT